MNKTDVCKMCEQEMRHASLVKINNKGILLCGKSGSGKSDLALRLIENKNATLVSDDVVILCRKNNNIIGKTPENIAGLLEVRGIGVVKYPHCSESEINLIVNLRTDAAQIERMPKISNIKIFTLEIPQIDLYAMEGSAPDKIMVALRLLCDMTDKG